MKGGKIQAQQQEIRRQRFAADLRVVGNHADEKQQGRNHGEGPRQGAGNERIAVALQMPQNRQNDHRADHVIAGVGKSTEHPSLVRRGRRQIREDSIAEGEERQHHEDGIHGVEENRNPLEQTFHGGGAVSGDETDAGDEAQSSDQRRPAQERRADGSRLRRRIRPESK